MMVKKPNAEIAAIAERTALVLTTVNVRALCSTMLSGSGWSWANGVTWNSSLYPLPPLRKHPAHPVDGPIPCVDCHYFESWRKSYVERAERSGGAVLPEMLAPDALPDHPFRADEPARVGAPQWMLLVAMMIEAAAAKAWVDAS